MSAPSAINNAKQILIGGQAAKTTANLKDAAFEASTGEIAAFSVDGTLLTEATAATTDQFVIAVSRGAGKSPIVSDVIDKSRITSCKLKVYSAATEQVTAVGYNGTSGLIADVATYAGELYKVGILVHQFLSGTDSEKLKAGYYQSQLTDGQAEIALGLANSINKNFAREVSNSSGDKPVVAKAICNDAGAAITGTATNWTVSRGSKLVSADGTVTNVSVGDYVRLGGLTTSDAIYKVEAITSGATSTITLVSEYVGSSATIVEATAVEVITAALGAAANWGVILEGKSVDFDVKKKRYAKVRFDVTLNEAFGSTVASNTANAFEGTGTYQAVAQLERFLNGFRGESYEMGEPFIFNVDGDMLADSAVAGGGYDIISIAFSSSHLVGFQNEIAPKELLLAIPATPGANSYAITGSTDDLTDVLEVLAFGSANGNLTIA